MNEENFREILITYAQGRKGSVLVIDRDEKKIYRISNIPKGVTCTDGLENANKLCNNQNLKYPMSYDIESGQLHLQCILCGDSNLYTKKDDIKVCPQGCAIADGCPIFVCNKEECSQSFEKSICPLCRNVVPESTVDLFVKCEKHAKKKRKKEETPFDQKRLERNKALLTSMQETQSAKKLDGWDDIMDEDDIDFTFEDSFNRKEKSSEKKKVTKKRKRKDSVDDNSDSEEINDLED